MRLCIDTSLNGAKLNYESCMAKPKLTLMSLETQNKSIILLFIAFLGVVFYEKIALYLSFSEYHLLSLHS